MRLKGGQSTLLSVISYTTNLQEALAVTAGDLRAIVVKLAIVYVILVLGVYHDYVVVLGLRCLLSAIQGLLWHLLRVYRLLRGHSLHLLLRCTIPSCSITSKTLTHFSFVSILIFCL